MAQAEFEAAISFMRISNPRWTLSGIAPRRMPVAVLLSPWGSRARLSK